MLFLITPYIQIMRHSILFPGLSQIIKKNALILNALNDLQQYPHHAMNNLAVLHGCDHNIYIYIYIYIKQDLLIISMS